MTPSLTTVEQMQNAIQRCDSVRVRAGGTKSSPTESDINLAAWAGITEYVPEECVFTARAGTTLREIDAALRHHGQYLPFDPPFADDGATIGGTVAAGVSGSRRYRYGGVRDFLIGVRVIDGEGRLIRSGGKVVKNAAGFLLHHGVVGSCGRFGVLTEVTFKVFPAPEARRTLSWPCGSVDDAFRSAQLIETLRLDCEAIDFDELGTLHVTIAGRAASIEARAARLATALDLPTRDSGSEVAGSEVVGSEVAGSEVVRSVVKVAGLMRNWQKLQPYVAAARFMCAGAVAWLTTNDLAGLERALAETQLTGQVIRGHRASERIGHLPYNEFEERVRRVLDPQNRFSAAPHSNR